MLPLNGNIMKASQSLGATAEPWHQWVADFCVLVDKAETKDEITALMQHLLRLHGARDRSAHVDLGASLGADPVSSLAVTDKTLRHEVYRWLPCLPEIAFAIQSIFVAGGQRGQVGYGKDHEPWGSLTNELHVRLAAFAGEDARGKVLRRSFFTVLADAGAGEVPIKGLMGHGDERYLPSGGGMIIPQGTLLRGEHNLISNIVAISGLRQAVGRLCGRARKIPRSNSIQSEIPILNEESISSGVPNFAKSTIHGRMAKNAMEIIESGASSFLRSAIRAPDSISLQSLQCMLVLSMIMAGAPLKQMRRYGRYINSYCWTKVVANDTKYFFLCPYPQSSGLFGFLPLQLPMTGPFSARWVIFLQGQIRRKIGALAAARRQHREIRDPREPRKKSSDAANWTIFQEFDLHPRLFTRFFNKILESGGKDCQIHPRLIQTVKSLSSAQLLHAAEGIGRERSRNTLPDHVIAALWGYVPVRLEYFSPDDLLSPANGAAKFSTMLGDPYQLPGLPTVGQRNLWTKWRSIKMRLDSFPKNSINFEGAGFEWVQQNWASDANVVFRILKHMPHPSFAAVKEFLQNYGVINQNEINRIIGKKTKNHGHQFLINDRKSILASLTKEECSIIYRRQAKQLWTKLFRGGLVAAAQPLRLIRPSETNDLLAEVEKVIFEYSRLRNDPTKREAIRMMRLGIGFGFRIDEVCNMYKSDIETGNLPSIRIPHGKTPASKRLIDVTLWRNNPICDRAWKELKESLQLLDKGRTIWPWLREYFPLQKSRYRGHRSCRPSAAKLSDKFDDWLHLAWIRVMERYGRPVGSHRRETGSCTFHTLRHAAGFRIVQDLIDSNPSGNRIWCGCV